MKLSNTGLLLSLSLLAACTAGDHLADTRFATGSSTITSNADHNALYVVNTDAGSLSRTAPGSTSIDELPLGLEPTRVARAGETLFVTLRGERSVAMISLTESGSMLDQKIEVGAEPFGVVAAEKGDRVYVSVSQGNKVVELNGNNGNILRSWDVPYEPRYIALHPNGKNLYVAGVRGRGRLFNLDLRADETEAVEEIPLPTIIRLDAEGQPVEITGRITGDMAVSPNGDELVIPVIYVDNKNPVEDPVEGGNGVIQPVEDGYGTGGIQGGGIDRFNPGVVVVDVVGGSPDGESAEAIFVSGLQEDFNSNSGLASIRNYPSSVTISPDGILYYLTFEGSDSIGVVGKLPFESQSDIGFEEQGFDRDFCCDEGGRTGRLPFTSMEQSGFTTRPKMFIRTAGWAPTGLAFLSEDDVWVHESMSRAVSRVDAKEALQFVKNNGKNGFDDISFNNTDSRSPTLAAQVLPPDVFEGRRLFFSATNNSMAASGAGVSCATCHPDGRNDGLTWNFDLGMRQSPSLAGPVSQTTPVTWTRQVDSVAHEARITTEARMGGTGLTEAQLGQVAAYIDWTGYADTPLRGATSDAIQRGKLLFEREDVGCAECHQGSTYSNAEHYPMFGLEAVNTPTLVGIAGSGPYLHDGRATSLRDVLDWSRTGEMGDTSMLSESEMEDLAAYLGSL